MYTGNAALEAAYQGVLTVLPILLALMVFCV